MYSELKKPVCPKCEDPLFMDDPGVWYCENGDCNYTEYNNITNCMGDCLGNLVLSKDFNFDDMEERYCQVEVPDGPTCLQFAEAESQQAEFEYYQDQEHMKHCNSDTCECRFL